MVEQRDALTSFRDIHVRQINIRGKILSEQAKDLFDQNQTGEVRKILEQALAETAKVSVIDRAIAEFRGKLAAASIDIESAEAFARYLVPQNSEAAAPEPTITPPSFHPASEQPTPGVSSDPDRENLIREITSKEGWKTKPYPDRIADLVSAFPSGIERHLVLGLIYDPNSDNVEARFNNSLNKARNRVGIDRTIVSDRRTGRLTIAPAGNGRIDTPDVKKN